MSSTRITNFMENAKKFKKWPKKDKQPKVKKLKINLFGYHAVEAAWINPKRIIKTLYVTEKSAENFQSFIEKHASLGLKRPAPTIVSRRELDKTLGQDTVHQNIAINAEELPERNAMDLIISEKKNERSTFVILDQVTDPHNVGAIMRSAAAFGLAGIVLQNRFAPDISGVLAKVACGAVEHLPVATEVNLSRAIETFKEHGYRCVALDERGEETIAQAVKDSKKTVLVMGAEGPGLRPSVRDACSKIARLEMHGALPSINVSNAAAISFYAATST